MADYELCIVDSCGENGVASFLGITTLIVVNTIPVIQMIIAKIPGVPSHFITEGCLRLTFSQDIYVPEAIMKLMNVPNKNQVNFDVNPKKLPK